MRSRSRSRSSILGSLFAIGALSAACAAAPAAPPVPSTAQLAGGPSSASAPRSASAPATSAPSLRIIKAETGAPDSQVRISVVSFHVAFSPTALSAPADKVWHLTLDLQDQLGMHNFTLESGPSVAERVFATPKVGVGRHEFDIPGLPAGRYLFVCTLHPETMRGTIDIG